MSKIYVHDSGWAGAHIYICDSMEEAIAYFSPPLVEEYEKRSKGHNYETNGANPWLHYIERYKNPEIFKEYIQEYEIFNGQSFYTEGEG